MKYYYVLCLIFLINVQLISSLMVDEDYNINNDNERITYENDRTEKYVKNNDLLMSSLKRIIKDNPSFSMTIKQDFNYGPNTFLYIRDTSKNINYNLMWYREREMTDLFMDIEDNGKVKEYKLYGIGQIALYFDLIKMMNKC